MKAGGDVTCDDVPVGNIGESIRRRRNLISMSQAELGWLAGVAGGTVKKVEGGRQPESGTAANISLALGCMPPTNPANMELTEVFSATATRLATRAIIAHDVSDAIAACWRDVVACRGGSVLGELCSILESRMSPPEFEMFEREVAALREHEPAVSAEPAATRDRDFAANATAAIEQAAASAGLISDPRDAAAMWLQVAAAWIDLDRRP
jgi:transcriptional regulator with XRE-family HTH domain